MTLFAARGRAYISVSASDVTGFDSGFAGEGEVSSDTSPSPVVEGGSGSYTYLWEHVSTATGNTPSISSPSAANPVWTATVLDTPPSASTWRLTVTDNVSGATAITTISVTLTWANLN